MNNFTDVNKTYYNMTSYELKTVHGYDFFQVASAFQKTVRRGLEDDAMYWAVELSKSKYTEYVWKRMIIMCSEDVGLADPNVIVRMMALKQSYDYLVKKDKSPSWRLPFTHAVVMLVRSYKSRYVDHAITVYWQQNGDERKEIPDYAFDMHTRIGKAKGRGLDYFYSESAKIANANKLPEEEELERKAMEVDKVYGIERTDISFDSTELVQNAKPKPYEPSLFG